MAAPSEKVAVLGLGYVGLPLAARMARAFPTVGFDPDKAKVARLRSGQPVAGFEAKQYSVPGLTFSDDEASLAGCTTFIICVPTPLAHDGDPDLGAIRSAGRTTARFLKKGGLVILESTTYPGTTDEVLVPLLEASGLKAGTDFQAAFSPERVDPGNKSFDTGNTPKLVGGIDEASTKRSAALYRAVLEGPVYEVSSAKVAEAAKVLENTFRAVNIALVNELAVIFDKLGIDAWEVIEAAATKPYGFMPHWPGPGVGGHCIPLDPQYLSYQARRHGIEARFIGLAAGTNHFMKFHALDLLRQELDRAGLPLRNSKVAIWGAAYKPDVDDTRESPTEKIAELLEESGVHVTIHDPFAASVRVAGTERPIVKDLQAATKGADAVLLLTGHSSYRKLDDGALEALRKGMRHGVFIDTRAVYRLRPRMPALFSYRVLGMPAGHPGHQPKSA